MKTTIIALAAAGVSLMSGWASEHEVTAAPQPQAPDVRKPQIGYNDRQIARIQPGKTAEAQLLEWFGTPENREVKPDGRTQLSWSFTNRIDGGPGHSGTLKTVLGPDGKTEVYAAHAGSLVETRTLDFAANTDADMREQMARWSREGWSVHSVSGQLTQADGTTRRKAQLSRIGSGNSPGVVYDDRQVAKIQRGETTQAELVEWFGPAFSRNMDRDGRAQLEWTFSNRTDGVPGRSGDLKVVLAPGDKVEAYSASRQP